MSWGLFDYNTWMNEEIDVNNALFSFEEKKILRQLLLMLVYRVQVVILLLHMIVMVMVGTVVH